MYTCPECQAQTLEYLYDLLDDADRRTMQAHLADCSACRAQLAKAENQQKLLATAARMEFPNVRFNAPAERIAPPVVPMTRPVKKAQPWRRWAVAALILLGLVGLSAPGYWMQRDYSQANHTAPRRKKALAAACESAQGRRGSTEIRNLPRLESEKIEGRFAKAGARRALRLSVRGPSAATAGAPTTYELDTSTLNGEAVPAELKARLMWGEGKQPFGDALPVVRAGLGKYKLTLPADLPLKPQQPLTLWVSANRLDGVQSAQVSEKLDLAAPVFTSRTSTPINRCTSPAKSFIIAR